jgi:predicted NUDIX family NTP pyrophosphohydrolase
VPPKQSAGLLMFRRGENGLEVLLAHPGGPFWEGREDGAWTIPKGGIHDGEPPLDSAVREFKEETGFVPSEPYLPLGHIIQRSGKIVHAWAFEGNCDPSALASMEMTVEWPPRSGRQLIVPEVDRVAFFSINQARIAVNPAQAELFDRLMRLLTDGLS